MGTKKIKKKRLVILDSHAIIHRAYHALPDFSSSKGEPTGALYGLVSMLFKLVSDLEPDYIVAGFDLPGPTHRHDVFEEYKAARVKSDSDLIVQIQRSRDVFNALSIPLYEKEGFEADDVIGTITENLKKEKDVEVIIASGDMDTLQLVSGDGVRVFTLRKGLSDTILYDEDAVQARFGFGPELIPDYKGLRGDPSDNIPGVRGIGEKTATDLIQSFGTLENIYATLKKDPEQFENKGLKPRVVKLLQEGEDIAVFSKMLATIRVDAPVDFALPKKEWRESVNTEKLLTFLDTLEFRSLSDRARQIFKIEKEEKENVEEVVVDKKSLKETSVALWLLRSDMTEPSKEDILRFAGTDDFEKAREKVFADMRATGKLSEVYENIEKPLMEIVEEMQKIGIELDTEYLKKLSKKLHTELEKMRTKIYKHAGEEFNVNSPKQLGNILFDKLQLKTDRQKKTETGQRSTRESELEKMRDQHPIIDDILLYRELQKLLSTYIDNLPELIEKDGRLHAEFLQAGSTTGRMASQNPGLQNIPIRGEHGKKIRNAFVAAKGFKLVSLDYSQMELRVAAALSGDEKLVDIFKSGGDVHTAVASEVFEVPHEMVDSEMRRRAKVINFGILYGMGVNALKVALGEDTTRNDAQKFLNDYFKNFSGLAHYIERVKIDAAHHGFTETMFGRRRYFSGFESGLPYVRAQAERMAINAPIQGTQADIIKMAMIKAHTSLKKEKALDDARLLLQVHDELVYEIREGKEHLIKIVHDCMESIVSEKDFGGVPIIATASIGANWGEMEQYLE